MTPKRATVKRKAARRAETPERQSQDAVRDAVRSLLAEPDKNVDTWRQQPVIRNYISELAEDHSFPLGFDLLTKLDECWLWWCVSLQAGRFPSGRERRDLLDSLAKCADRLVKDISEFTRVYQFNVCEPMPGMDLMELETLERRLEKLSKASRAVIENVQLSQPGRRGQVDRINLLCRLWRIYRDAFGHQARRVTRVGTMYSGRFFDFANATLPLFGIGQLSDGSLGKMIQKAQEAVRDRDARTAMP